MQAAPNFAASRTPVHPAAGRGYLSRQLRLWEAQWRRNRTRQIPVLEEVAAYLRSRIPATDRVTIVHGDYKLDNVLFAATAPPELLAVVDWEMASIGDPLVDLAWAMIFHPGPEGTMPLGVASPPAFAAISRSREDQTGQRSRCEKTESHPRLPACKP